MHGVGRGLRAAVVVPSAAAVPMRVGAGPSRRARPALAHVRRCER